MVKISKADSTYLDVVVPLFDAYRMFYEQESNEAAAYDFLSKRFSNNESVILLAFYNDTPCGFVQLYTTFSSVSMQPLFILNDLYVAPPFRKKGIGTALLNEAKKMCDTSGYKGLALETAIDNSAQKLYETLGWKKDRHSFHYFWTSACTPST